METMKAVVFKGKDQIAVEARVDQRQRRGPRSTQPNDQVNEGIAPAFVLRRIHRIRPTLRSPTLNMKFSSPN